MCPWNVSFTTALREPAFAPSAMLLDAGSRDGTRALAREIVMMGPADYATASKGSAIKRAKLWMLQRNACVVLGNVGTDEDLAVLETMLAHEHDVVRENAAWAVARIARIALRSRRSCGLGERRTYRFTVGSREEREGRYESRRTADNLLKASWFKGSESLNGRWWFKGSESLNSPNPFV